MGERATKDQLFAEFAAVGKVLGNAKRLELLDLLAQGPRSVDDLAAAAGVGVSTCSAQLQIMREAGLVETRRDGKRVYYSLAGHDIAGLLDRLRTVAQRHRPHTELARRAYLGPEDTESVDTDDLMRRLRTGDTVVLDVRPQPEYAGGHLPGAIHIPLDELEQRLGRAPPRQGDRRLLPRALLRAGTRCRTAVVRAWVDTPAEQPMASWSGGWPASPW